jgi:hypothetical protein
LLRRRSISPDEPLILQGPPEPDLAEISLLVSEKSAAKCIHNVPFEFQGFDRLEDAQAFCEKNALDVEPGVWTFSYASSKRPKDE